MERLLEALYEQENSEPAFSFGRPLSEIGKEFFVTEKQARLLIHTPSDSNANTWRLTVFYVRAPDWRDKLAEKLGMLLRIVNLDSVADRIPNEKAGHIIHSPEVVD